MANNLRIVYDNAGDRASIAASSTAGALVASNLQNDIKSQIWRSVGTTATLTLTWPNGSEMVGVVTLPFNNFTSTATIQVQGYTNIGDSTPLFDTGAQYACPSSLGDFVWGSLPLGVNAYSFGGGSYATIWFPIATVRKLVVTLVDASNTDGYLEAARLVTGSYWEPTYSAQYGAEMSANDTSKHERSDSGDLHTDRGPQYRSLTVDIQYMPTTDRNQMWRIALGNGMGYPVYFSLTPENSDDTTGEQIFQLYGKLSKSSSIKYQFYNQFNSTIELEEI
jgi:hypothetical protein